METTPSEDLWNAVRSDRGFRILVWGPTESHRDYQLRASIHAALSAQFPVVLLEQESLEFQGDVDSDWLASIAHVERLETNRAQVVYVVATCPDSKLKVVLFNRYQGLWGKMHVLVPDVRPRETLLDRVFEEVLRAAPRSMIHELPALMFRPDTIAGYCVDHAKKVYRAFRPDGPPRMSEG